MNGMKIPAIERIFTRLLTKLEGLLGKESSTNSTNNRPIANFTNNPRFSAEVIGFDGLFPNSGNCFMRPINEQCKHHTNSASET